LRTLGYLKQGLDARKHLALIEPINPLYRRLTAELMLANGMLDEGIKDLESLHGAAVAPFYLAPAYAQQGRFTDAVDVLRPFANNLQMGPTGRRQLEAVMVVLSAAAKKSPPPASLPALDEFSFAYAYISAAERTLDWPENALKNGDFRPVNNLWWPTPASVRMTQRFKALVRQAGLVDYWKARGWPDLCHPVGADDFECN